MRDRSAIPAWDPIPVLQSAGYTEREAAFLYLVALHSGYFLRRQYVRFIERGRGALAAQLLRRAIALGHIRSIACGQARFVYHLTASEVYAAAGLGASHHRRLASDATIKRRLMVLDFVLDALGETLLDTRDAKVRHCTGALNLDESVLPHTRGVAFAEEFPLIVRQDSSIAFTYFDEGALSMTGFERFLNRYASLFAALPRFELLYVSDADLDFARVSEIFATRTACGEVPGTMPLIPHGADHFLAYLRARELARTSHAPLTLRDLAILREGEAIYTHPKHQPLLTASSVDRLWMVQQLAQKGQHARITAVVLPYSYPLHHFKHERPRKPELGSRQRSIRRQSHPEQTMQEQLFSEEGNEA